LDLIWRKIGCLGTAKVKIVKNERDPPLFTGKLLIKFQNILRNTTHVIVQHRICLQTDGRTWWNQYTPLAVPELLDLIWRKIGFLPYVVW
jgi:hypothetical protein